MENEGDNDDDDVNEEEEAPLSERTLNLELRFAEEERDRTIVAMEFFYLSR